MRAIDVSRRALAAVARLTVLAGAAGCAGNIVIEPEDVQAGEDPGEADPNQPPDLTIDPNEPESACFVGDQDPGACCAEMIADAFSDDTLYNNPSLATDDERDCCEHIVTAVDTWMGPGLPPFDYSLVAPCCGAGLVEATFEAHPSCTPWGPPMPPAMPCGFTRPRPVPAAFAAEVLA